MIVFPYEGILIVFFPWKILLFVRIFYSFPRERPVEKKFWLSRRFTQKGESFIEIMHIVEYHTKLFDTRVHKYEQVHTQCVDE